MTACATPQRNARRGVNHRNIATWLGKLLLGQKDTSKVETSGPEGKPVLQQVQVTLSDEEIARVMAFLE